VADLRGGNLGAGALGKKKLKKISELSFLSFGLLRPWYFLIILSPPRHSLCIVSFSFSLSLPLPLTAGHAVAA
jgi:hypothetical protein